MTQLPDVVANDAIVKEAETSVVFYHNWMYSFLPAYDRFYLLGYCKNCRNSVCVRLESSGNVGEVVLTKTEIPREGCSGPA